MREEDEPDNAIGRLSDDDRGVNKLCMVELLIKF